MKVRITKVGQKTDAVVDPHGNRGIGHIQNGHVVEGILILGPTIGDIVLVARTKSNGIKCSGFFRTSPVVSRSRDLSEFETENSKYKMEFLQ